MKLLMKKSPKCKEYFHSPVKADQFKCKSSASGVLVTKLPVRRMVMSTDGRLTALTYTTGNLEKHRSEKNY